MYCIGTPSSFLCSPTADYVNTKKRFYEECETPTVTHWEARRIRQDRFPTSGVVMQHIRKFLHITNCGTVSAAHWKLDVFPGLLQGLNGKTTIVPGLNVQKRVNSLFSKALPVTPAFPVH